MATRAIRFTALTALLVCGGCATHVEPGLDRALAGGPRAFLELAVVGPLGDGAYVAPTQQHIDPPGIHVHFPGRPVDLAVHPGGKMVAVKNRADVELIDIQRGERLQTLGLPGEDNSYQGIAWTSDGQHLWTTGARSKLHQAGWNSAGELAWTQAIALPEPAIGGVPAPGGFALDEKSGAAYVALSRNNSVAVVDLKTGEVRAEIAVGISPYDVLLHGNRLYVSILGGRQPGANDLTGPTSGSKIVIDEAGIAASGTVSVIDLTLREVAADVDTGLHPSGMVLDPEAKRLYVANANSDTVSVINVQSLEVDQTWSTKPLPELPFGSAPNALALSPGGDTLYVANGGNNCIAVVDTHGGTLRGLIPTGWYPGAVALAGNTLCIANVKGIGARMLDFPEGRIMLRDRITKYNIQQGYNSHDHQGSVSFIETPGPAALQDHTFQAAAAMRLPEMHRVLKGLEPAPHAAPVPTKPGETSPIKHVLYIIKENRTYDQVFGDVPQGNGAPELCHFGREVTPNHHALAEEFVLLDNFYCNGVLSADGHQWTDEGYVVDYIEKSFGGFPRSYPYDGDDAMAYASSGFIWDHVLAKGLSFRNYGEMVKARIEPASATWTDIYQDYLSGEGAISITARTEVRGLEPYICPDYVGFPGKVQDVYRAQVFLNEFQACVDKGTWYNFVIMLLPNDHTVGTREGYPTPRAAVADNDLALGRIVEAVSNSPFWKETAIFVVQDDPQAGVDHVDGHRTVALCISPYTRRGAVVSTFYNQNSMLRTMELILGLAPMNQLNMAATPMTACFQDTPDYTPYRARPNQIPLDEMNPAIAETSGLQRYYAQRSMELPLDDIDMADESTLNRIIWHSVKGYDVPYPVLARRPIVDTGKD